MPIGMDPKDVFALALGLDGTPWTVVGLRSDPELKRLDIEVDFPPGSRLSHPESGPCGSVIGGHGIWGGSVSEQASAASVILPPAWSIRSANCAKSARPSTEGPSSSGPMW